MASTNKKQNYDICVGVVTCTKGVKGNVKIKSFTANPKDLASFRYVFSKDSKDMEDRQYKIKIMTTKGDVVIAGIDGIQTRNEAEKLCNTQLFIKREDLPEVSNDEFYHTDLHGLEVRSERGGAIGTIRDVVDYGAGDIIEIYESTSESVIYYPFNAKFVSKVDLENRYIVINNYNEIVASHSDTDN